MPNQFYAYYDPIRESNFNWQNMYDLSKSYLKSIRLLLTKEREASNSDYSHYNIYPVMVLLHNYIELVFKSLIMQECGKLIATHDLEDLKDEVEKLHPHFETKNFEAFIKWLSEENPGNASFRYDVNKKNEACFVDEREKPIKGVDLSWITTNTNEISQTAELYFKDHIN